jgi:hypothetical protein
MFVSVHRPRGASTWRKKQRAAGLRLALLAMVAQLLFGFAHTAATAAVSRDNDAEAYSSLLQALSVLCTPEGLKKAGNQLDQHSDQDGFVDDCAACAAFSISFGAVFGDVRLTVYAAYESMAAASDIEITTPQGDAIAHPARAPPQIVSV